MNQLMHIDINWKEIKKERRKTVEKKSHRTGEIKRPHTERKAVQNNDQSMG